MNRRRFLSAIVAATSVASVPAFARPRTFRYIGIDLATLTDFTCVATIKWRDNGAVFSTQTRMLQVDPNARWWSIDARIDFKGGA